MRNLRGVENANRVLLNMRPWTKKPAASTHPFYIIKEKRSRSSEFLVSRSQEGGGADSPGRSLLSLSVPHTTMDAGDSLKLTDTLDSRIIAGVNYGLFNMYSKLNEDSITWNHP